MKVKFLRSIGTIHAKELAIPAAAEGSEVDVPEAAAEKLLAIGLIELVGKAAEKAKESK